MFFCEKKYFPTSVGAKSLKRFWVKIKKSRGIFQKIFWVNFEKTSLIFLEKFGISFWEALIFLEKLGVYLL